MGKKSKEKSKDHPLQPVLEFIDGRVNLEKKARSIVKEIMFDDAKGKDHASDPTNQLLVLALKLFAKPGLTGDQEKQAEVDRIIRRIQSGAAEREKEDLDAALQQLAEALQTLTAQNRAGADFDKLKEVIPPLLEGLRALDLEEGSWLSKAAESLIKKGETGVDADFLDEVARFGAALAESAPESRKAWLETREAFKKLVADLTERLKEAYQESGAFTEHLDNAHGRIEAAHSVNDLAELRETLLGEVDGLRKNARKLTEKLLDTQDQLKEYQERTAKLQDALERSREEGVTDPLTQIFNRRAFDDNLEREVARCIRHGLAMVLILFDLDHFKAVNDDFGHPVGDKVLAAVAQRAKKMIRQTDTAARYGGEEFAIILTESDLEAALPVAEKIRADIERLRFKTQEKVLQVTSSFGLCQFQPGLMTLEELVERTDKALYDAKDQGRNCVVSAPVIE